MYRKMLNGYYLELDGSFYEQGKKHGEVLKAEIQKNIDRYKEALRQFNLQKINYEKLVDDNFEFLKKNHPEYAEELQGLSDGSEIELDDILFINIPLYFILRWLPDECSSILARNKATADGKTYLIKNRDMGNGWVEHAVIKRTLPNGKQLIEVSGAGMITFPGNVMNCDGLAISTSGVWSDKMSFDLNRVVDSHALINSRLIAENAANVDEAIDYIEKMPRMTGLNIVLADKEKAVSVEVTKDNLRVANEADDIIVRTNHYEHPDLVQLNPNREEYKSTFFRKERAEAYLQEHFGDVRLQEMIKIASDHENGPINTICRHPHGDVDSNTIYTSIIVVEDFEVWTTLSQACLSINHTSIDEAKRSDNR
ncbi:C45 family autoproteolytic acyltransferase/hydolase [Oceanobacillus sojae]|uniref:C45 family autoproteolytic acyltransferase/hydolase n=1 Tax=Oceanobacillus sojae TaxID=582851 RepID=UPI00158D279A|nr:C45 family peptidase [Oceanobacillus sojae]